MDVTLELTVGEDEPQWLPPEPADHPMAPYIQGVNVISVEHKGVTVVTVAVRVPMGDFVDGCANNVTGNFVGIARKQPGEASDARTGRKVAIVDALNLAWRALDGQVKHYTEVRDSLQRAMTGGAGKHGPGCAC